MGASNRKKGIVRIMPKESARQLGEKVLKDGSARIEQLGRWRRRMKNVSFLCLPGDEVIVTEFGSPGVVEAVRFDDNDEKSYQVLYTNGIGKRERCWLPEDEFTVCKAKKAKV